MSARAARRPALFGARSLKRANANRRAWRQLFAKFRPFPKKPRRIGQISANSDRDAALSCRFDQLRSETLETQNPPRRRAGVPGKRGNIRSLAALILPLKSELLQALFGNGEALPTIRLASGGLTFSPNGETMSPQNHELSARGSRRLTLTMMAVREQADQFEGLPTRYRPSPFDSSPLSAGSALSWLAAAGFQADRLACSMTQAQDWEIGSRPITWPSAARQSEFLGLTKTPSKPSIAAVEAGVFVLRDSPTGKRYGRRDRSGQIVEAYGFDLSPLAFRTDEFIRLAAEARPSASAIGH